MINAGENSRLGHLFRPGPFSRDRAYWLDGHVLRWRRGVDGGWVALGEIAYVHVALPVAGAGTARCTIRTVDGQLHRISDDYWFGWTLEERHRWGIRRHRRESFLGLVSALVRRVRKANPQAVLRYGHGRGRPFEPEEMDRSRGFIRRTGPVTPEQGEDGKIDAA